MRWHALSTRRSVQRGGARPGHCSPEHPSRSSPTPQFCGAAGGAWDGNHLGNQGGGGPSSQAPHLEPSSHHASGKPRCCPLRLPSPLVSQGNGASPRSRAGSDEGLCLKGRRGGTSAGQIAGMDGACCRGDAWPRDVGQRVGGEAPIQASGACNSGTSIPAMSQG